MKHLRAPIRSGSYFFAAMFCGFMATHAAVVTSTNLRAYYQFNSNGGDSSGNSMDTKIYGEAGYAVGLFGQALDLKRNNSQYAQQLVDDQIIDFGTSDFTIQTWVNFNDLSSEQTIIEKFTGSTGPGWTLTKRSSNSLQFYSASGQVALNTSSLSIALGVWHDIVIRRNGGLLQMFYDNSDVASQSTTSAVDDTSAPLLIGKRNASDGRDFSMNGKIDEVAIWTRALSDIELTSLYNNGLGMQIVPEPSTFALLVAGAGVFLGLRCRR